MNTQSTEYKKVCEIFISNTPCYVEEKIDEIRGASGDFK